MIVCYSGLLSYECRFWALAPEPIPPAAFHDDFVPGGIQMIRMNRIGFAIVLALAALPLGSTVHAQFPPQYGAGGTPIGGTPTGPQRRSLTQDEIQKLGDFVDTASRLTAKDKANGKTMKDLLAEDKAAATALVQTMPLSCDVTDAVLAAQGPATIDGRAVATKTYEVVCSNSMGYFLVDQAPGKPYGFSCFAADASRVADEAQGRPPGVFCRLAANADIKTMATAVAVHAGTACVARDVKWIGVSSASNSEFAEVACSDGTGYILKSAAPGSTRPVAVIPCHDAAMQGLPCKLTKTGPIVTVQTLKDAIAKHGVSCDATNVRVIGQENALKRYVVELQCPQQPKGLVAFVPLDGNTAKFEALDCAAAVTRGIDCKLSSIN